MKPLSEAIQKYRDATTHKQRVSTRRRELEAQRAQLMSEQAALELEIGKLRAALDLLSDLGEIRETRRRISALESERAELAGLLGERALDPSPLAAEFESATRKADNLQRIVFSAKLRELLDTAEASAARAFAAELSACLALSGSDTPDLVPTPAMVEAARSRLMSWLSDAAQA